MPIDIGGPSAQSLFQASYRNSIARSFERAAPLASAARAEGLDRTAQAEAEAYRSSSRRLEGLNGLIEENRKVGTDLRAVLKGLRDALTLSGGSGSGSGGAGGVGGVAALPTPTPPTPAPVTQRTYTGATSFAADTYVHTMPGSQVGSKFEIKLSSAASATSIDITSIKTPAQFLAEINAIANVSASYNAGGQLAITATDGSSVSFSNGTGLNIVRDLGFDSGSVSVTTQSVTPPAPGAVPTQGPWLEGTTNVRDLANIGSLPGPQGGSVTEFTISGTTSSITTNYLWSPQQYLGQLNAIAGLEADYGSGGQLRLRTTDGSSLEVAQTNRSLLSDFGFAVNASGSITAPAAPPPTPPTSPTHLTGQAADDVYKARRDEAIRLLTGQSGNDASIIAGRGDELGLGRNSGGYDLSFARFDLDALGLTRDVDLSSEAAVAEVVGNIDRALDALGWRQSSLTRAAEVSGVTRDYTGARSDSLSEALKNSTASVKADRADDKPAQTGTYNAFAAQLNAFTNKVQGGTGVNLTL